ncbi:DJ-1 family protein [bacterium (Candidatus Gribaldobacteria) CG08_land_8_20_14_0_20_39_15]|uniref:DJ-1 family protein n=1 Tax=bacterium (Candidatus Gribaldobacteria) CG08_land_8_20_14_0_20_39_15 TaxID=2014273 RepID=A0A2M6XUZ8_9BACT|nr:MAG: DJ-1 family protein [bacterium (Candidatus Gribaldobacteria) CG08_land_8_20_14_0_20_39_15]
MKKQIAMVIAQQDFRDEEYFIPKAIFETAGFEIKTIGLNMGEALGFFGSVAAVDLTADKVKPDEFAAVVFIGGSGMEKLMDNKELHKLAQAAVKQGKIVAGICIAPAILAKAGVLSGKKATVWADEKNRAAVKILEQNGAYYIAEPVVIDGKIITANGPYSARKFAEEIVKMSDRVYGFF